MTGYMQEALSQADRQKQLEKNNSKTVHGDGPVSRFPWVITRAASGGGNLHYFLAAGAASGGGILRRVVLPLLVARY